MMMNQAQFSSVAITGHRLFKNRTTENYVQQSCQNILTQVQRIDGNTVVGLSGLAEGADTLFAEIALAHNIPVRAVLAYENLEDDFTMPAARERYRNLLSRCQTITTLPFCKRSEGAYIAVGYWLVDHCDLLIAAWDGLPARGLGGTGDVVAYAQRIGKPVVHIHTVKHCITLLHQRSNVQYAKNVPLLQIVGFMDGRTVFG